MKKLFLLVCVSLEEFVNAACCIDELHLTCVEGVLCVGNLELDNWVFCLNELRNYCAHYNRLYASVFPVEPRTPDDFPVELQPDVFGYIIVLKQFFHNKANWNERVVKPLSRLIKKSEGDIRLSDLGFPENWEILLPFVESE